MQAATAQQRSPLQQLWDDLRYFDWFHDHSDDPSVRRDGAIREAELRRRAESIEGGLEMFQAWRKHVWTGPSFGTPKAPKPERPAQ